ncbi:hypothetical protein SAMN05216526_0075 [Ectothiorhodosinus mongolicus]|uniref:Carboxypeptidase regulatory-like domain-containing protein n=2 Tax=Ectothiorhodosinus mongolicus TaxID=233100 RepID=A0A1R3VNU8_9GAMM|nr:hypothetical protein CKX93_08945 [Ectothiorhodosinus mongolicus]SIT65625.1 hypothetical protein SAMN05216526_0075 [Ectothiorhodosinus mongolicus]
MRQGIGFQHQNGAQLSERDIAQRRDHDFARERPQSEGRRCISLWLALVAFLWLVIPAAAMAHALVHLVDELDLVYSPGSVVSFAVRLENPTDHPLTLRESLHLPPSLRSLMPERELSLAPNEVRQLLVALTISNSAPAGPTDLQYGVIALTHPEQRAFIQRSIHIAAHPQLAWRGLDEIPPQLWADQTHEINLALENTGNVSLSVELDIPGQGRTTQAHLSPETLTLEPGQTQPLTLILLQPIDLTAPRRISHRLRAQAHKCGQTPQRGRTPFESYQTVHSQWLPTHPGTPTHHNYPLQLTTSWGGDNQGSARQWQLTGSGAIDEHQRHHWDLRLRLPDDSGRGLWDQREEMAIAYRGPEYAARLGDLAHTDLPMLGQRYGRGISAEWRPEDTPWTLGSYHLPRTDQHRAEQGAHLGWAPNSRQAWQLHLWQPEETPAAWGLKTRHEWRVDHHLSADLAYQQGYSWSVESRGRLAHGGLYRLTESHWHPALRHYATGTKHPSANPYRPSAGSYHRSAQLDQPLGQAWRLRTRYRSFSSPSLEEQQLHIGARWQTPLGITLDLEQERYTRGSDPKLRTVGSDPQYVQYAQRWGLAGQTNHLSYRMQWRRAGEQDQSITLGWRPSRDLQMALYWHQGPETVSDSRFIRTGSQRSVSFTYRPAPQHQLQLQAAESSHQDQFYRSGSLQWRWQFSPRQSLTLSLQHESQNHESQNLGSQSHHDTRWFAQHHWSFQLPIRRRQSVGSLHGCVDFPDQEQQSKDIRTSVLIWANQSAARLDAKGCYRFRGLPIGPTQLRLQGLPTQWGLTPRKRGLSPFNSDDLRVDITGGTNQRLDITLVRTAQLSGQLKLTNATAPLPRIWIELHNDSATHRTQTDSEGHFTFERLLPGEWQLRLSEEALPRRYSWISPPAKSHILTPGYHQRVELLLNYTSPQWQFIDSGVLR